MHLSRCTYVCDMYINKLKRVSDQRCTFIVSVFFALPPYDDDGMKAWRQWRSFWWAHCGALEQQPRGPIERPAAAAECAVLCIACICDWGASIYHSDESVPPSCVLCVILMRVIEWGTSHSHSIAVASSYLTPRKWGHHHWLNICRTAVASYTLTECSFTQISYADTYRWNEYMSSWKCK